MNMTGNTILVTGGTSGIGRGLAEAFHARGNRVIVTGRRQALLDRVTAARPGLVGMPLDLDDPTALPRLATEVRARFPELNVLIANAGISRAEDMTADGWDVSDAAAIVETNILGVLRTTAAFLPLLKRQPKATIVATSSNLAFVPRADFPDLLRQQGFPALLAAIGAASAPQCSDRGARTGTTLCADGADRHAAGVRPARHAPRCLCRRGDAASGAGRSRARRGAGRTRPRQAKRRARRPLRRDLCGDEPELTGEQHGRARRYQGLAQQDVAAFSHLALPVRAATVSGQRAFTASCAANARWYAGRASPRAT